MLSTILGWITGAESSYETRLRRFRAEVAEADRRLRARQQQTPPDRLTVISQSENGRSLNHSPENVYNATSRPIPTPTCCPQSPGAHLVQRYSPWIAANHEDCAVPIAPTQQAAVLTLDPPAEPLIESDSDEPRRYGTLFNVPPPNSQHHNAAETSTDEAAEEELLLTCPGRFQHVSNADLQWLKQKIEHELRGPGAYNLFGPRMLDIEDHPLVQQYNKRREAAIAAGEDVPEQLELEWSLANRMRPPVPTPTIYNDEWGVEVQLGFHGITHKTSSGYSDLHGFAKWQFADADVVLDTEVTRLKEMQPEGHGSTIKLVIANESDGLAGTDVFVEANKTDTPQEGRDLNDRFSRLIGKQKGQIRLSESIRVDSTNLFQYPLEDCALESDSDGEGMPEQEIQAEQAEGGDENNDDNEDNDDDDNHQPDEWPAPRPSADMGWMSKAAPHADGKGKGRAIDFEPLPILKKTISTKQLPTLPSSLLTTMLSHSNLSRSASPNHRHDDDKTAEHSNESTQPSSPPSTGVVKVVRRVRFASPEVS